MFFTSWCFFFVTLLLKMPRQPSAGVLGGDAKLKKVVMGLLEKLRVLDKLCSG